MGAREHSAGCAGKGSKYSPVDVAYDVPPRYRAISIIMVMPVSQSMPGNGVLQSPASSVVVLRYYL